MAACGTQRPWASLRLLAHGSAFCGQCQRPCWPITQPCRILTALGQDTVMGANTHLEHTEPAPGVICAQGGESPELGVNTRVLVLSGLPSIPPCSKSCCTPFSGPLDSHPVYSVRKMRGLQHLPTPCHPLAPVRCDWLAVPLAGPAPLEGGAKISTCQRSGRCPSSRSRH